MMRALEYGCQFFGAYKYLPPLVPLINFSKIFQPGNSYSNPPAIKFWEKFHPTQAFKIYTHFVYLKIQKVY